MKEKKLILIICLALVAGVAYTIFACLVLVPSGINLSKTCQHDYSSNGNTVTNRCKYCNKHYDCVRNVHSWVDSPRRHCEYCKIDYDCKTYTHKWEWNKEYSGDDVPLDTKCKYCKMRYDCASNIHSWVDSPRRHCEYCKIDYDCKTYTHKWESGNGSSYDNIPLDTKCKYCKMRYDCANDLHKYHPSSIVQKGVRYICKHCRASHVCETQGHKWVEMKVCCPKHEVPLDDQHDERGIVRTICRICNTGYDCSKFGHDWSGCGMRVFRFHGERRCRGKCRKCGSVSGDRGCGIHGNHVSAMLHRGMNDSHCEFYDNRSTW